MAEEEFVVVGLVGRTPNLDERDGNIDPEDFIFNSRSLADREKETEERGLLIFREESY